MGWLSDLIGDVAGPTAGYLQITHPVLGRSVQERERRFPIFSLHVIASPPELAPRVRTTLRQFLIYTTDLLMCAALRDHAEEEASLEALRNDAVRFMDALEQADRKYGVPFRKRIESTATDLLRRWRSPKRFFPSTEGRKNPRIYYGDWEFRHNWRKEDLDDNPQNNLHYLRQVGCILLSYARPDQVPRDSSQPYPDGDAGLFASFSDSMVKGRLASITGLSPLVENAINTWLPRRTIDIDSKVAVELFGLLRALFHRPFKEEKPMAGDGNPDLYVTAALASLLLNEAELGCESIAEMCSPRCSVEAVGTAKPSGLAGLYDIVLHFQKLTGATITATAKSSGRTWTLLVVCHGATHDFVENARIQCQHARNRLSLEPDGSLGGAIWRFEKGGGKFFVSQTELEARLD
ncbi:MAG TPA: hypothetical protein VKU01_23255 [Bryobacteraceae bacterium]|nr:hypothetical protein [Bryobacteraceae bacterium]